MLNIIYLVVQAVNLIFIFFVLFFERKESTRRFVWLLLLLFLPVFGGIFYILFSGNFFTGTKRMHQVKQGAQALTGKIRAAQLEYLRSHRREISNDVLKNNIPLIEMNLREGKSLLVTTNNAVIYTRGEYFFYDLCKSLEGAKKSICMEYFIFRKDKIGRKIMEILCKKAREGLDVKLIYDDLGCFFTPSSFFKKLNSAGGSVRPFFQIRLGLPLTLNYRNHRKLTVIDSHVAFIGGMNIGDEYANQKKSCKLYWRDTVVRLTGTSVLTCQLNFLSDWYSMDAWKNRTKSLEEASKYFPSDISLDLTSKVENSDSPDYRENIFGDLFVKSLIPTQIVTAGPNEKHKANIEDSLIRMIMGAKKNIYIQTPYFTPDDEFCTALKLACYSGVKIKIMIPEKWDKFYMKAASSEFAREMAGEGVEFFLYPGFIHSKMISIDGEISSIGTTNIDVRSFRLHFEENAIFYDRDFTAECERIFSDDLVKCKKVLKEDYDRMFILRRAFNSFCKLFSPLM